MTMVREVVAIVSGAIYCFRPPPDLERPERDSLSRRLRVSCYLELVAYALLYIPHLFLTLLWNNSEAILTMLFLCVDVEHLDHGTLSKAIFVGDYIGFMAANALISWLALQYALGLAALRVELLSQPRCSLTSMFRRRRRLARHFAFPLLLWCCNTAVGFTVALRQSMHSINITGQLSALLLYSIFQHCNSLVSRNISDDTGKHRARHLRILYKVFSKISVLLPPYTRMDTMAIAKTVPFVITGVEDVGRINFPKTRWPNLSFSWDCKSRKEAVILVLRVDNVYKDMASSAGQPDTYKPNVPC
ncbi:uncharacterized protein ISCGN_026656 [Ixodes scapularis]